MPFPGDVCMECGDTEEECEWIACCGMYMCLSCETKHDDKWGSFAGPDPLDD